MIFQPVQPLNCRDCLSSVYQKDLDMQTQLRLQGLERRLHGQSGSEVSFQPGTDKYDYHPVLGKQETGCSHKFAGLSVHLNVSFWLSARHCLQK